MSVTKHRAAAPAPQSAATERVELTFARLRRHAADCGFTISADERISEVAAARLLEMHPDTLARKRAEGTAPVCYGLPLGRAKVSYRLTDLALWIESRREKSDIDPA